MSDIPEPQPPSERRLSLFRWQALLDQTSEPLFLLSQQRRVLFVNRAWEKLTGLGADQVLGLVCSRRQPSEPGPWDSLGRVLCPPPNVLKGRSGWARRLYVADTTPAGQQWWDLDFFSLPGEKGLLGILGKISVARQEDPATLLPAKLVSLRAEASRNYNLDHLGENSPAVERVAAQARLAGRSGATVLIKGERGVGKEWLARAIHHQGEQNERTFISLDCQCLPVAALEAVLFGPRSLLNSARTGTVYLKEPTRLPRDLQTRLLNFLKENADARPRWISGLSMDAEVEVKEGRFLAELHGALGTLVIALPALRDRASDLDRFVDQFLARIKEGSVNPVHGLTPAAWDLVRNYSWPGNLAELHAVLLSAAARTKTDRIDAPQLPASLRLAVTLAQVPEKAPMRKLPLDELLEKAEKRLITLALKEAKGNKSKAAEILSIWRPRLLRRMEALGLDAERREVEED